MHLAGRLRKWRSTRYVGARTEKRAMLLLAVLMSFLLIWLTARILPNRIRERGMEWKMELGIGLLKEKRPLLSYIENTEAFKGVFQQLTGQIRSQERLFVWETGEKEVISGLTEFVQDETEGVENAEPEVTEDYLPVSYVRGNIFKLPAVIEEKNALDIKEFNSARLIIENHYSIEKLSDPDFLLSNYYIVDSVTSALPSMFRAERLLARDMSLKKKEEGYQILIYHTHATEGFADSRQGVVEDTVRGPGELLAQKLRECGYTVYHDMTAYDEKDGKDNRNYAYSTARPAIEAFLAEHPEVEVIIDLHRDSGKKRTAVVAGKPTAKVMLFNGLCRNTYGPIDYLDNPNLEGNLAFSLQVNLIGRIMFPDFMHRIYLKNYRYNQHFRERDLLIELGTEENTLEEAYNAMEPLAQVLDVVLRK